MRELNVSMAGPGDIPQLAELKSAYVRNLYKGVLNTETLDRSTPDFFVPSLTAWLQHGTYRVAFIRHEGTIGNYLVYGTDPKDPDYGMIYEGVCDAQTTPEEKRMLMEHCLNDLRGKGHTICHLWVLVDNFRVRFFYESCGFRPNGTRKTMELMGQEIHIARYVYYL